MPHLIRISTQTWQELDGVQEPFTIKKFQGVWTANPMAAPDGYAADISNLSACCYPALSVRPGLAAFSTVNAGPVQGIGVRKDNEFFVVSNGEFFKVTSWGEATLVGSLQRYSGTWTFTNFRGNAEDTRLFGADGFGSPIQFDGSTALELGTAPQQLAYIESHLGRLFGAVYNTLHFSALNKSDDWSTAGDSGSITVESPKGSQIAAVKSGLDRLVVMTTASLHELYGAGPSTFRMVLVSDSVGCASNNSCVVIDGTLYWLGRDGLYRYRAGSLPDKSFSIPVQSYVDRVRYSFDIAEAYAATDGRRYYLAVPLDTHLYPRTILEYDTQFETWMVWNFNQDIRALTSFKTALYVGFSDGSIHKLDPQATTDNGTPIQWKWESTPIGSGSYITRKRWYDMWLVVDLPTGSSLDVYLSPKPEGDDSWVLVRSLTASTDTQSVRIIVPVETIANANWVRVRLVGAGPAKVHEFAYRERILPV